MPLAIEIDAPHLFEWENFLFEGTPFAINRVVVLMLVASLICVGFFIAGARRRLIPRGIQYLAESAYFFVRNQIAVDVIGPNGVRYAPYLASLFFFIFFMNLMEIIPVINFPVTSRMAIPASLAFFTWVIFNAVGIIRQGPLRYFKDTLFPPGVPWPVYILLVPIEFASVFIIRPLTLAIRLFANMMAGHVLLTIFFLFTHQFLWTNFNPLTAPLGLVTAVVAAVLILFELLVISLQAYIFTMLTAFYISESEHGHGAAEPALDTDRAAQIGRAHV